MHSSPNSHYQHHQPIYVSIPEYTPELYLTHPNTSLQSLLSAETSSISSPTSSVSGAEFDLYTTTGDHHHTHHAEFYNPSQLSMYATPGYANTFADEWSSSTYAPSSPSGSIHYFPDPTLTASSSSPSPQPAKRQRKNQPEPCNCMYCLPTSAPSTSSPSSPGSEQHNTHTSVPRQNGHMGGAGVMHQAPPLQLQFQLDIAPKPIIIGQHGLGADAAFLLAAADEGLQQQQMELGLFDGEQHFYAHGY